MAPIIVYTGGSRASAVHAGSLLKKWGISTVDHPTPEVTHLLLDVPVWEISIALLERLPEKLTVVGGNLSIPELGGYETLDLLKTESYLARNAAITAECALQVAMNQSRRILSNTSVLVIGWGRIGKCLSNLLKQIGCSVTVAARKETDLAILEALGYETADPRRIRRPDRFSVIFNTAPSPILGADILDACPDTLKIDLASSPGLSGSDVIWARGLPGIYAPESSGQLIAETFLKEVSP